MAKVMAKVKIKKAHRKFFLAALFLFLAASLFLLVAEQRGGVFRVEVPESSPLYLEAEHPVFVYGTLRFALVRQLVFGGGGEPQPAVLPGYRRQGLDLLDEAESQVTGLLLQVGAVELAAMDRYERVGVRYQRLPVILADGTEAWVYRRL
ncbi:gamma-glutamylcyclotransferase family protein [Desulfurivibrio alkaliphilus]|uniref:AIG2 family protein n=1 Tax=Desulfurivibrio alkaliphilus (strain DSM 19089 / UNIQEM U267 / AHT2) TaxID=589865 RepID=D6Z6S2_DESAT|nr:gamma-glutamylcyclotransferase family protein [Desulfurivibrio alkaliphilus]ADH85031.1 AIG2 family protein [Desulfurivibrio alkaliphilus AHT 2]